MSCFPAELQVGCERLTCVPCPLNEDPLRDWEMGRVRAAVYTYLVAGSIPQSSLYRRHQALLGQRCVSPCIFSPTPAPPCMSSFPRPALSPPSMPILAYRPMRARWQVDTVSAVLQHGGCRYASSPPRRLAASPARRLAASPPRLLATPFVRFPAFPPLVLPCLTCALLHCSVCKRTLATCAFTYSSPLSSVCVVFQVAVVT